MFEDVVMRGSENFIDRTVFIVLMASSLFWIPPTEHGVKVAISTAAIFSLMAYYVQLGRSMPRVDYLTKMDWFIVGATFLVFLSFSYVVFEMSLVKRDLLPKAARLRIWAKALYPAVLILILFLAFS